MAEPDVIYELTPGAGIEVEIEGVIVHVTSAVDEEPSEPPEPPIKIPSPPIVTSPVVPWVHRLRDELAQVADEVREPGTGPKRFRAGRDGFRSVD